MLKARSLVPVSAPTCNFTCVRETDAESMRTSQVFPRPIVSVAALLESASAVVPPRQNANTRGPEGTIVSSRA